MSNSRKQIINEIAQLNKSLQFQKMDLTIHKEYFTQNGSNPWHFATVVLLVSAFFIGWSAERKHWDSKMIVYIIDALTLAFLNYFKKTLFTLFK